MLAALHKTKYGVMNGFIVEVGAPQGDSDEFIFLAQRVGYTTDDWQTGARHLQMAIEQHMTLTKNFVERTFRTS